MPPPIETYKQAFAATWRDDTPVGEVRFAVLDSETTGFSPVLDRILTIGAVAVQDGEIRLDDSFDALLRVTGDVGPVDVHGVTPEQTRRGYDEREAVEVSLKWSEARLQQRRVAGAGHASADAATDEVGGDGAGDGGQRPAVVQVLGVHRRAPGSGGPACARRILATDSRRHPAGADHLASTLEPLLDN